MECVWVGVSTSRMELNHRGRATHTCVSENLVEIMAVRRQAKIWNNTLLLLIRNKSSEILIQMKIFSLREMSLKCRLQNGCHFHSTSICLCLGWRYVMERFSSALRVLERGIPNSLFPALLVHGERKPHAIYRFSFQRANFADRFFFISSFCVFFSVSLKNQLITQSHLQWFQTPWSSCDIIMMMEILLVSIFIVSEVNTLPNTLSNLENWHSSVTVAPIP